MSCLVHPLRLIDGLPELLQLAFLLTHAGGAKVGNRTELFGEVFPQDLLALKRQ